MLYHSIFSSQAFDICFEKEVGVSSCEILETNKDAYLSRVATTTAKQKWMALTGARSDI